MTYYPLGLVDLALAGLLLIVNAAISIALGLRLERALAIAAVRMVIQLAAIGFVLKFIFAQGSPWLTAAFAAMMLVVASWEAWARQRHGIGERWWHWGLGASALMLCGLVGTLHVMTLVIAAEPWWSPRYLLPILGMMLGNAMTGVALVLDTLAVTVKRERNAIEAKLALGASRFEAMRETLAAALRTAMTPLVNMMAAAGVVSLPGMMTGQIIAGIDPVEAAKYQVMILCVIAGVTALGTLLAGVGALLLLTDARHRLRFERIGEATEP